MQKTYENATGKIDFTLKNNYMFQFVLQNKDILKGLLCSLLDLEPENIIDIRILNPIERKDDFNAKTFIMDILILLNNDQRINLEMQVENEDNWPDRSLSYLCRSFDNLIAGENYKNVRAAIHIGILDFELFPDHPEFYSDNRLMNVKTHEIYDDKFRLRVLSLKHIKLATPEDKAAGRDKWAALFRAGTWEELKMAATQSPYMEAAAKKLFDANGDYVARERARALEDSLRRERQARQSQKLLKEQAATLKEQETTIRKQKATLKEQETALAENADALAQKDAALAASQARIAELERQLAAK